ncbi:MAG: hypothetical protein IT307_08255, partial [Chloroflexi bacterium]|nr:hypothetical protein [Chloroflexota bacterium]
MASKTYEAIHGQPAELARLLAEGWEGAEERGANPDVFRQDDRVYQQALDLILLQRPPSTEPGDLP